MVLSSSRSVSSQKSFPMTMYVHDLTLFFDFLLACEVVWTPFAFLSSFHDFLNASRMIHVSQSLPPSITMSDIEERLHMPMVYSHKRLPQLQSSPSCLTACCTNVEEDGHQMFEALLRNCRNPRTISINASTREISTNAPCRKQNHIEHHKNR